MPKRIYDGSHAAVVVTDPATGVAIEAERGVEVDVSVALAAGLDASGDWLDENRESTAPPAPTDEPLPGYDELSVKEIVALLQEASVEVVAAIKAYETDHKNRKTVTNFQPATAPDGSTTTDRSGEAAGQEA